MTSAWSITAAANPPRAAFLDFPLGHTAGPPHDPVTQLSIMRDAFAVLESASVPGHIVPLDYTWPTPWKAAARQLIDHRTPRFDTPQYQTAEDERAAIDAHGEELACGVCEPAAVPVT